MPKSSLKNPLCSKWLSALSLHRSEARTLGKFVLQISVIVVAVAWIYGPVLHGGWLMDDDRYLSKNPLLHDPDRFEKIWFVPGSFSEYYPIEETICSMQWFLWGNDTLGYHVTNVCLHLTNALLVWRLFRQLALRLAWLGGVIFAVHPLQVESVAWISELKNTLSFVPFVLAISAWIKFEERRLNRDYRIALAFFFVAMLCKISMAAFPAIILLYAWWKRGRVLWEDLKRCAPFLLISILLMTVGDWAQSRLGSDADSIPTTFFDHVALINSLIFFYLAKFLWPTGFLVIYPPLITRPASWIETLPLLLVGIAAIWFWFKRNEWGRHALLGLGFFLANLLPVIGFICARYPNLFWSLDHLLYVPVLGLIGILIAIFDQIKSRIPFALFVGSLGLMLLVMTIQSHRYAKNFISQEVLWSYTLEHNAGAEPAYYGLGNVALQDGRLVQAISFFQQAIRYNPNDSQAHSGLGLALSEQGRLLEAVGEYEQSLAEYPRNAPVHYNFGKVLLQLGRINDAVQQFREVLEIASYDTKAHNSLGVALAILGRRGEAETEFETTLRIEPGNSDARAGLDRLRRARK